MSSPSRDPESGPTDERATDSSDPSADDPTFDQQPEPADEAEHEADRQMADAARRHALGMADDDEARRLDGMDGVRSHEDRRRAWMHGADDSASS